MKAGQYITDGTAIFILDDVRDGNRVGDIVLKPTLNDGYIKANGATVKASEYPRLLKFAQDNGLCVSEGAWSTDSGTKYVYDESADTLKVPNAVGRVLQGDAFLSTKNAGLPNITGNFVIDDNNVVGLTTEENVTIDVADGTFSLQKGTQAQQVYDNAPASTWYHDKSVIFDASRSNAIYGASATVQPPACCLIAQIKY